MTHAELVLRSKLISGLKHSYDCLIRQKQHENSELIFTKDGKIISVKARCLETISTKFAEGI